jgi:hypothetical protein
MKIIKKMLLVAATGLVCCTLIGNAAEAKKIKFLIVTEMM